MDNKKWLLVIPVIIVLLVVLIIIRKNQGDNVLDKVNIEISIKDYGKIQLELDGKAAPITVKNFVNLVKDKYYDGLKFHRIMKGFMMQGGSDPSKPVNKIKGEFKNNGIENPISHTRGTISMARATDMNSASSGFFIVHQDSLFLDGNYAGFGHVTSGIEVVDAICESVTPTDNNGTIPQDQQPVIEYIKII